jgi:hypothetical protein
LAKLVFKIRHLLADRGFRYRQTASSFAETFEQTDSQIDIDSLVARYDAPDFWHRALIEAPDDSLA